MEKLPPKGRLLCTSSYSYDDMCNAYNPQLCCIFHLSPEIKLLYHICYAYACMQLESKNGLEKLIYIQFDVFISLWPRMATYGQLSGKPETIPFPKKKEKMEPEAQPQSYMAGRVCSSDRARSVGVRDRSSFSSLLCWWGFVCHSLHQFPRCEKSRESRSLTKKCLFPRIDIREKLK